MVKIFPNMSINACIAVFRMRRFGILMKEILVYKQFCEAEAAKYEPYP